MREISAAPPLIAVRDLALYIPRSVERESGYKAPGSEADPDLMPLDFSNPAV